MDEQLAREMYKEHILELYNHPHNFGELEGANKVHREHNPLCGDEVIIQLIVKDGVVSDVKFKGHGCAISIASVSLLTDKVKGMKVEDVMALGREEVLELLQIPISPVRLKCALLCLETMHKAVLKKDGVGALPGGDSGGSERDGLEDGEKEKNKENDVN